MRVVPKPSGQVTLEKLNEIFNVDWTYAQYVWLYHFGDLPDGMKIEHIDWNTENNRIQNLRAVSITKGESQWMQ